LEDCQNPRRAGVASEQGLRVIVVTNQSGIARGHLTEDDLGRMHRRMIYELYKRNARLDAIYYCPHHPDDGCGCRKHKIGLLLRAERGFSLDLKSCFMVERGFRIWYA